MSDFEATLDEALIFDLILKIRSGDYDLYRNDVVQELVSTPKAAILAAHTAEVKAAENKAWNNCCGHIDALYQTLSASEFRTCMANTRAELDKKAALQSGKETE